MSDLNVVETFLLKKPRGWAGEAGWILYLYLILSFKVPTISTVLSYNPQDSPALKKFFHFLLSWRHFGMAFLEPTPPTLKETVWPVGLTVVRY